MTTFHEITVRCAVCGERQRALTLTSTSQFGPPDLDLRPAAPKRWALRVLGELEGDEQFATTADVARYIGELAAAGDDAAHCCAEAFAVDE